MFIFLAHQQEIIISGTDLVASKSLSKLDELFRANGLSLSAFQLNQFEVYHRELLEWNRKANLISKNDEGRIPERHFVESALLALGGDFDQAVSVLDLGTGGGFPGVPLKIIRPQLRLALLDSRRWKGLFLRRLVQQLQLQNVEVICERAEILGKNEKYQASFETVVTRAVAQLDKLYRLSRPFLKPGGKLVTIKGSNLDTELTVFRSRYPDSRILSHELPGPKTNRQRAQSVVIIE